MGVEPGRALRMTVEDGMLTIVSLDAPERPRGSPWLRELYDYFAPVREQILADGYTEEEINADIDAAIAESRTEQDSDDRDWLKQLFAQARVETIEKG